MTFPPCCKYICQSLTCCAITHPEARQGKLTFPIKKKWNQEMRGLIETLVVTTGCTQYLSELSSAVGSKLSASAFWKGGPFVQLFS